MAEFQIYAPFPFSEQTEDTLYEILDKDVDAFDGLSTLIENFEDTRYVRKNRENFQLAPGLSLIFFDLPAPFKEKVEAAGGDPSTYSVALLFEEGVPASIFAGKNAEFALPYKFSCCNDQSISLAIVEPPETQGEDQTVSIIDSNNTKEHARNLFEGRIVVDQTRISHWYDLIVKGQKHDPNCTTCPSHDHS